MVLHLHAKTSYMQPHFKYVLGVLICMHGGTRIERIVKAFNNAGTCSNKRPTHRDRHTQKQPLPMNIHMHTLVQKVNAPNSQTFTTHTQKYRPPRLLSDEPSSRQGVWDSTP